MFGQFGCMPLWQTTCQGLRTIHGGGGGCCSASNKCCEGTCPKKFLKPVVTPPTPELSPMGSPTDLLDRDSLGGGPIECYDMRCPTEKKPDSYAALHRRSARFYDRQAARYRKRLHRLICGHDPRGHKTKRGDDPTKHTRKEHKHKAHVHPAHEHPEHRHRDHVHEAHLHDTHVHEEHVHEEHEHGEHGRLPIHRERVREHKSARQMREPLHPCDRQPPRSKSANRCGSSAPCPSDSTSSTSTTTTSSSSEDECNENCEWPFGCTFSCADPEPEYRGNCPGGGLMKRCAGKIGDGTRGWGTLIQKTPPEMKPFNPRAPCGMGLPCGYRTRGKLYLPGPPGQVFPWNPCRPNPCGTPAICCKPCFLPPLQPTPPGFATTLTGLKLRRRKKLKKKRSKSKQADIKLEYRRGADYRLPPRQPCPGKGRLHMGHAHLGGLCPLHFAQFGGMMGGRGMMGRGMMGGGMGPYAGFGMGPFGMGPYGEAMGRGMYGPGMGAMMGRGMGPWMGRESMMGRGMGHGLMGPGEHFRPGTAGAMGWGLGPRRSKASMGRPSKTRISKTDLGGRHSKARLDVSGSRSALGRPSRTGIAIDKRPSRTQMGARPSTTRIPSKSMIPGQTTSKSMLRPSMAGAVPSPGSARQTYGLPPKSSVSRSMAYPRDSRFGSMAGRPSTGGLFGTQMEGSGRPSMFPGGSFSAQPFMGGRPSMPRASSIFGARPSARPSGVPSPPIPAMAPSLRQSFIEKDVSSTSAEISGPEKPGDREGLRERGVSFGPDMVSDSPWTWQSPGRPSFETPDAKLGRPSLDTPDAMLGRSPVEGPDAMLGRSPVEAPDAMLGMPSPLSPDARFMWPWAGPAVGGPAMGGPGMGGPAMGGAAMEGFTPFPQFPYVTRTPCGSFGGRRQRSHSAVEPRPIGSICALCPCARHHVSKAGDKCLKLMPRLLPSVCYCGAIADCCQPCNWRLVLVPDALATSRSYSFIPTCIAHAPYCACRGPMHARRCQCASSHQIGGSSPLPDVNKTITLLYRPH